MRRRLSRSSNRRCYLRLHPFFSILTKSRMSNRPCDMAAAFAAAFLRAFDGAAGSPPAATAPTRPGRVGQPAHHFAIHGAAGALQSPLQSDE